MSVINGCSVMAAHVAFPSTYVHTEERERPRTEPNHQI